MMNSNEEPLLRVTHLCQYFKSGKKVIKAVDDVSFEVHKGEVFGLVGESGCGKTTTGRSIIRLYDITGGSVYFDGIRICAGTKEYKDAITEARCEYKTKLKELTENKDGLSEEETGKRKEELLQNMNSTVEENRKEIRKAIHDHKNCNKDFAMEMAEKTALEYDEKIKAETDPEKLQKLEQEKADAVKFAKHDRIMNRIQMIFQDPIASLDPRMTVHDIIAEGLIIRGMKDQKKIDEMVYEVLRLVGLVPEHASRYPHEFSGGQRQRIGIARAIVLHPDLIIADEPISALDVSIQAQVINLLNKLRNQMNLTILFIAHDLSVVKYFSDRIAVMYFGHIVELATADELFAHPLHPYTKSLLSAIPLPDPKFEKKRKRITYNPLKDHDYTVDKPSFREVSLGHFVSCNDMEFERYKEEVSK